MSLSTEISILRSVHWNINSGVCLCLPTEVPVLSMCMRYWLLTRERERQPTTRTEKSADDTMSHAQECSIHSSSIQARIVEIWNKVLYKYTSCQARSYSIRTNLDCLKKCAGVSTGIFLVAEADCEPHSKNLKFKRHFTLWVINVQLIKNKAYVGVCMHWPRSYREIIYWLHMHILY